MMMENGISMEYTDGYMEQEEEWEREGLLDPAWEKQQKKVCTCFIIPKLRIKAVNNRLKVIISGLDVCGTQIVVSIFFFEYFLDSPTSRQHQPKCECYANHSNFNKNQAPLLSFQGIKSFNRNHQFSLLKQFYQRVEASAEKRI